MRACPRMFFAASMLMLSALLLAACGGTSLEALPTFTPDPALALTSAALFPTPVPTEAPTPTPVARGDDSEQIAALLSDMETALLTRQSEQYLSDVDLSDPVFALEHRRWVEDWTSRTAINRFDLTMRNLTITGDEATADLNMLWTTVFESRTSHGADFPVRFRRGEDGRWRYAGEAWVTVEAGHFRVRALPGLEDAAQEVIAVLPDVYTHVTTELDHTPAGITEVKLYDDPWNLIATVRLSITREISGWNEPGEAIKMVVPEENFFPEITLAHEFAHVVMFDMAGMTRGQWPWWVAEGMAEYAASEYWTFSDRSRRVAQVQEWRRTRGLADWTQMSVFETTPEDLWPFAYTQGYAFIRYVTETYGLEMRNVWIQAMADSPLAEATQAAFSLPFEELSAGFLDWLDAQ